MFLDFLCPVSCIPIRLKTQNNNTATKHFAEEPPCNIANVQQTTIGVPIKDNAPVWCCDNATNDFSKCDYGICNACKLSKEEELQKLGGGRASSQCRAASDNSARNAIIDKLIDQHDQHPPLINDINEKCNNKFSLLSPVSKVSQFTKQYKKDILSQEKIIITKCYACEQELGKCIFTNN